MLSKGKRRVLVLWLFEAALACGCCVAATYARFGAGAGPVLSTKTGWLKILTLVVVVQISFYIFDLYDLNKVRNRYVLYIKILQATGLASLSLGMVFFAAPALAPGRGVYLLSLFLMFGAMVFWRLLATWLVGHPALAERVLILGTNRTAIEVARQAASLLTGSPTAIDFDHNTVLQSGHIILADGTPNLGISFTNNLTMRGFGIFGSGLGEGVRAMNHYFPDLVFKVNVTVGAPRNLYPSSKNFYPGSIGEVGFVDEANRNYRLSGSSPYRGASRKGKDIGANIDEIETAMNASILP